MRRREAILALCGAGLVVLALSTVFAIELSNTQAKSKRDVESRVHERGVLAGALIDSLFSSVQQQVPQEARTFGGRTVSARTMDHGRAQGQDAYLALLNARGRVIAHSGGFTAQARADLAQAPAVSPSRAGGYALGNLVPYGKTGAIDFAVVLPTRFGLRKLITGFAPATLSTFITADLLKIPGSKGRATTS